LKVTGYNWLDFSDGGEFTVECESFIKTDKTFLGTPIYKLIGVDFSTLESENGGIDGVLIEVRELNEGR
jgi:hypothetical protein